MNFYNFLVKKDGVVYNTCIIANDYEEAKSLITLVGEIKQVFIYNLNNLPLEPCVLGEVKIKGGYFVK